MKRKQIVAAMVFAWAGLFIASSIASTVPGLVLHYTFDETADYDVMDSSGNGYTGTVSSSSGWAPTGGQLGGALTVGGHRKAYPPMGCISNLTAVTVSAWIKGGTDGSSFFFACAATNESGATKILDAAATPAGFSMTAGYNGNSYSSRSVTGSIGSDTNVWEHWSMTFEKDPVSGIGTITAYQNAMAIGTNSNVEADRVVSGIQFSQIGRNNGSTFKGQIDDFRIYDRALNAAELATVMTGDTGLPAPGYETWLAGYTLGAFTNLLDDAENGGIGDGLDNLTEYALGSAPDTVDNPADVLPISVVDGAMLNYIYTRQNPMDTNLTYTVLDGTDLVTGGLLNTNTSETVSGGVDGFETVTNQVSTAVEGQQFMQLSLEYSN